MRKIYWGTMALVMCGAAQAQTAGGPQLGWVVGEDSKVRAMEGVPGAGRMGADSALPAGWTMLAMHPRASWAAVVSEGGQAGVWRLDKEGVVTPLEGSPAATRWARWSPLGMALIVGGEAGEAQVWKEREGGYELAGEVTPGTREVAVSDDGAQVAAIEEGSLVIYREGGRYAVADSEAGGQISFIAGGKALAHATAGWLRVYDEGVETARAQLAGEGPVKLASPAPDVILTVSVGEASTVRTWDARAEMKSESVCPVAVRSIGAVGRASTLRLDTGGGTVWLVETMDAAAKVFFVPPAVEMSEGGEQ